MKNLSELLDELRREGFEFQVTGGEERLSSCKVASIAFDSREVQPDAMFFALPGTHVDGKKFIPHALKGGASVIVYQDLPAPLDLGGVEGAESAVFIRVPDSRKAMSPVADVFFDRPSRKLAVIGVTGTEGKSSTVSFVWQLLRLFGRRAGFISTVEYSFGTGVLPNPQHQTTPEAPVIQAQLAEMVRNGCEFAVVESSSHGLSHELNRLGDVAFDCGIFMNVTLEHLEFHKTFEKYRSDKANLFRTMDKTPHEKTICGQKVAVPAFGIVNAADKSAQFFRECTGLPVLGFSADKEIRSEVNISDVESGPEGISFNLNKDSGDAPEWSCHVEAPLPGGFNAQNLTAAIMAVSRIAGIPAAKVAFQAQRLVPIRGRMTVLKFGQPFLVVVDYAHTPSSFETIFPSVRKRFRNGKMIAVFGSGGERNLEKRPLQGKVAAKYCDALVLADEDPRGEDPVAILEMIAEGARGEKFSDGRNLFLIPDRKKAIRKAFSMAASGDVVMLLGKSHENSIIYKDFSMPYDEISEAESALHEMGFK